MKNDPDITVTDRFDERMITEETKCLIVLNKLAVLDGDDLRLAANALRLPQVKAVCRLVTRKFGACALLITAADRPQPLSIDTFTVSLHGVDGDAPEPRPGEINEAFVRRYVRMLHVFVDSPESIAMAVPENLRVHTSRLPAGEIPVGVRSIRKNDEPFRVVRLAVGAG
jgi:hypothetical protein